MKTDESFIVTITEKYTYDIRVSAKSKAEALRKTETYYNNPDDGVFCATANSFDSVKFNAKKANNESDWYIESLE